MASPLQRLSALAGRAAFILKRDRRKFFHPRLLPQARLNRRGFKVSAYLSIYNDWELLGPVLAAIADHVDELVVVDGAYEWMQPFLRALGLDPLRSDQRVYDAIAASGIPFRVITGAWQNEPEKRRAGYAACGHRFAMRIDADEVLFFDDDALERFFGSGCALAEMAMPTYVAPGLVSTPGGWRGLLRRYPSQRLLFDRDQISADEHLHYLWLVLGRDNLAQLSRRVLPVFEIPVAFNAHLTHWRGPQTALTRGAFYMFNWMRQHGVPWVEALRGRGLQNVSQLLPYFPADAIASLLSHGKFSLGSYRLEPGETLRNSQLTAAQEHALAPLFANYLAGFGALNQRLAAQGGVTMSSDPGLIDLTTPEARTPVLGAQGLAFTLEPGTSISTARLHVLTRTAPFHHSLEIAVTAQNGCTILQPSLMPDGPQILRQVLEFNCAVPTDRFWSRYQIAPAA